MRDRRRAEELLAQAWERPPAYGLERVEMLLSALVHAVLASSETTSPARDEHAPRLDQAWTRTATIWTNDSPC